MEWIDSVLREVAELPDRNSPEGWPEAMLVTGAELRQIIITHAPAEPVNAEMLEALKAILADGLHCDVVPHLHRRAAEAIARAESSIETPAKVSPCAGHAVQQEADETTKRSSGLFKCWICLDTGFIPKAGGLPEPPDVKCPNGCKPKKGGTA